jgi:hypothetical protein
VEGKEVKSFPPHSTLKCNEIKYKIAFIMENARSEKHSTREGGERFPKHFRYLCLLQCFVAVTTSYLDLPLKIDPKAGAFFSILRSLNNNARAERDEMLIDSHCSREGGTIAPGNH